MSAPAPLTGALDTLALADVLQLLDLGRKSGVLAVDAGDGRRRGLVRLADGCVRAARFQDGARPELRDPFDAVAAMLALDSGRFTFAADPAPAPDGPDAGEGVRVEALLMEAMRRLDEGAPALAPPAGPPHASPAAPTIPVLTADDPAELGAPVRLRAADWALLAAVDGRRDVAAVAATAGQPPEQAAAALAALARAGLVAFRVAGPADGLGFVAPPPARSSTR